ncbi:MAG: transcription antitermination factor NusB [bacterium]|nr:transcription antitermination factor NusB [bacterium]
MLNRRFLRIKAFQALYSFSREEKADPTAYRRRLLSGLEKTYELYLFLLSFGQEFRQFLVHEFETEKGKYIPSELMKAKYQMLLNNRAILILEKNVAFAEALKLSKVQWNNHTDLFRQIWNELKNHPMMLDYEKITTHTLDTDKALLGNLLEWLIAEFELFESFVEDRYANWEDDQVLVLKTLQKNLQFIKENSNKVLPEKHKDEEEDIKFLKDLFDLCVQHDQNLMTLIAAKTKNWDQDRIALVDLILMKMALCEVMYFPFIPVKVSINEYLELAKLYSTPNSHGFINGVLDKVQLDLKKDNLIKKLGRGLVD